MSLEDRKIDVNAMDDNQLESTISALSNKITGRVEDLAEDINKTLKRYGLKCKLGLVIEKLEDE